MRGTLVTCEHCGRTDIEVDFTDEELAEYIELGYIGYTFTPKGDKALREYLNQAIGSERIDQ